MAAGTGCRAAPSFASPESLKDWSWAETAKARKLSTIQPSSGDPDPFEDPLARDPAATAAAAPRLLAGRPGARASSRGRAGSGGRGLRSREKSPLRDRRPCSRAVPDGRCSPSSGMKGLEIMPMHAVDRDIQMSSAESIGVDLGGTKMLVGVLDGDSESLWESREASTGQTEDELVELLVREVGEAREARPDVGRDRAGDPGDDRPRPRRRGLRRQPADRRPAAARPGRRSGPGCRSSSTTTPTSRRWPSTSTAPRRAPRTW